MRKIVLFALLLLTLTNLLTAQTTFNFSTSPALSNQSGFPTSWKNLAKVTIGGVEYTLTAGGNGTWTHLTTGGNGNSGCLRKDGSGGDQLYIARSDGQPFQFYGLWLKHSSMYYLPYYKPPYYTINYELSEEESESFVYNNSSLISTETYAKNIAVYSVSISFSSMMYYWIDDLIVGPVVAALPLSATSSQVNIACNGSVTGSASVVATGGTSPYTYSWSPGGGSAATASGLAAGNYSCTITDAVSATVTSNFTLTQPAAAIALSSSGQVNVSCNGGSNGAATLNTPTGGTGAYTYNWTPGNPSGDGTKTVTGLSAGTWTATVTDANSCTATQIFTITQPPALTATTSKINVSCNAGSNGSASVTVTGGTPSYTYSWSPSGGTAASASGLAAGNYTCTIADGNSCSIIKNFTITEPPALSAAATPSSVNVCSGSATNIALSSTPTGASFDWTVLEVSGTVTGASASSGTTIAQTLSGNGIIKYRVTGALNSCSADPIDVQVTVKPLVAISGSPVNANANIGGAASFTVSAVAATGYQWQVNTGSGFTNIVNAAPYSNITTATLNISSATAGMNNYQYRCIVSGPCGTPVNSGAALLITKSNNAALSGALINEGTLSPAFNAAVTSYTAAVNPNTGTISITPFPDDENATVTINGSAVNSGSSANVALVGGVNTIHVVVTAEDGTTIREYTLEISRPFLTVQKIERASARITNASALVFNILFSGNTDGLTAANLGLQTSGTLSGYSIASVSQVSGGSYTVSVNTGSGNGILQLNIDNTEGLSAPVQDIPFSGESYVIDKLAPSTSGKTIFAVLDVDGKAFIIPSDINDGTTDNYSGQLTYTANKTEFSSNDLGENTISFTATDEAGNSSSVTVTVVIKKDIIAIAGIPALHLIYGVQPVWPASAEVTYSDLSKQALELTWDLSNYTGKAGQVLITGTLQPPAYTLNSTLLNANLEVIIDKRNLVLNIQGTVEKIYDGSDSATVVQNNFNSDKISGDELEFAGTAVYNDKNAGNQKLVTITDIVFSGDDAENYSLAQTSVSGSIGAITPRNLSVTMTGVTNKIYDGTEVAVLTPSNFESDKLEGDDLSFTATGEYNNKNAGESKTVAVSAFVLLGEDKNNYNLQTDHASITGDILAKEISLHANAAPLISKIYDGTDAATLSAENYSFENVEEGDDLGVTASTVFDNANAGVDKTVSAYDFALQGEDRNNYRLLTDSVFTNGSIVKKSLQAGLISDIIVSKIYDGNRTAALLPGNYRLSGLIGNDEALLNNPEWGMYDDQHTGVNKKITVSGLSISGNSAHNYVLSSERIGAEIGVIIPKEVTVTAAAKSKIYGSSDPALTYETSGLVNDDHLSGALLREAGKNAGNYDILIGSVNGGADYTIAHFQSAALTILPAELTVVAENKSRLQGSADAAYVVTYRGLTGGDSPSSLTSSAVASCVAVSISPIGYYDINVEGAESPNYHISYVKGKLTVLPSGKPENNLKVWSVTPDMLEIRVYAAKAQKAAILLYTNAGQAVIVQQRRLNAGVNSFSMYVGHLSSSLYVLNVAAEQFNTGQRIDVK